ncbi:hypothetical protein CF8_3581 [Nocardioides sp. CF8]|nr:hypothetical protein CF8_3581 [Nocardioides sp. CF8]
MTSGAAVGPAVGPTVLLAGRAFGATVGGPFGATVGTAILLAGRAFGTAVGGTLGLGLAHVVLSLALRARGPAGAAPVGVVTSCIARSGRPSHTPKDEAARQPPGPR